MISATALFRKKLGKGTGKAKKPDLKSAMAIIEAALLAEKVYKHFSGAFIIEVDIKWRKFGLPLFAAPLLKRALEDKGYIVNFNGPTGWEIGDGEIPDHINVLASTK